MKTQKLNIYLAALLFLGLFLSCTKTIDLKLNNDSGKLVIEGNITNAEGRQSIKLSQNVSFKTQNMAIL